MMKTGKGRGEETKNFPSRFHDFLSSCLKQVRLNKKARD